MPYTDEYLIEAICAGGQRQEEGIRQLYTQFFDLVRKNLRQYRQLDQTDVVSAYNSAVLSLRDQLVTGAFRGDSSLTTYLTRIFTNKCIDLLRQKKAAQWEVPVDVIPETAAPEPNALAHLVESDQVERIQHYLRQIGEICRQILIDSEYYGYTSEEIAERIGFGSAASVNSKKYTCLQKLRAHLAKMKAG